MAMMTITRPYQPYTATAVGFVNPTNVLTPDPKEAAYLPSSSSSAYVEIDIGFAIPFDTVFVGYTNDVPIGSLRVSYGTANGNETVLPTVFAAPTYGVGPQHFLVQLDATVTGRYIRIGTTSSFAAGYSIGVVAIGTAFRPIWGREYGSGRFLDDTSDVQRLFGGGWGINEGAITTGFQWSFGDLQPEETDALYNILRLTGASRTMLVVEDPAQTAGLNDRIHWGLMKLDAFERADPKNTKWSMKIADWA